MKIEILVIKLSFSLLISEKMTKTTLMATAISVAYITLIILELILIKLCRRTKSKDNNKSQIEHTPVNIALNHISVRNSSIGDYNIYEIPSCKTLDSCI